MPSYTARPRRMTDAEIVAAWLEKRDADVVAWDAGCSADTVRNLVKAAGHELTRKPLKPWAPALLISDDEICRRYKAGEDAPDIAKAAGCTAGVIYYRLKRAKVERRRSTGKNKTPRQQS